MRPLTELINGYLLGDIQEEERARLEERLFADEGFFNQFELAEDELIEAYVRGRLPPAQRALFESHFLASERRRDRLAVAQTLLERFGAPEQINRRTAATVTTWDKISGLAS